MTKWIWILLSGASFLQADLHLKAQPWTENFLEAQGSIVGEIIYSDHHKVNQQKVVRLSTSPYPDYQVDVQVEKAHSDKAAVRIEKLLISDLENNPVAFSCVGELSCTEKKRAQTPAFFEMAKNSFEGGFGVGRHVSIQKESYVQVFSYLLGGIGSNKASWAHIEVGMQYTVHKKQSFRLSVSRVNSFGYTHHPFVGFGSTHSNITEAACQYLYTFSNGLEMKAAVAKRFVHHGPIHAACVVSLGVSYSFSWLEFFS